MMRAAETKPENGNMNRTANRTGIAVAPEMARSLIEVTRTSTPSSSGDGEELARVRMSYAEKGEPVGTMPPSVSEGNGRDTTGVDQAEGDFLVLLDKVGERLAFERSGVRLYDALLSKMDVFGSWDGGPSREELEHHRHEELQHFLLLQGILEDMGGDPTAITPSANIAAVASRGLPAVLADPRTDLQQG